MRGLKYSDYKRCQIMATSHPSWVRGLKSLFGTNVADTEKRRTLRGCVDWNRDNGVNIAIRKCRTLRGCVDWNYIEMYQQKKQNVAPFASAWIEIYNVALGVKTFDSRTLRGCVDWNSRQYDIPIRTLGRTLRGCVDWNYLLVSKEECLTMSHPSRVHES